MSFLIELDLSIFYFINGTLSNPLFNKFMPFITDLKSWLIFYIIMAFYLIIKGGVKGRVVIMLIAFLLVFTVNSYELIKDLTGRERPCELFGVNLLINCPDNDSMPSGHAVDTFAAATLLSAFYAAYRYIFFITAFVVSLSRIFCGVHYPSDVLAGALYGLLCGGILLFIWKKINDRYSIIPS